MRIRTSIPGLVVALALIAIVPTRGAADEAAARKLPWGVDDAKQFIKPGMRFCYTRVFTSWQGSAPPPRERFADVLSVDDDGYVIEEWVQVSNNSWSAPSRRTVYWDGLEKRVNGMADDGFSTRQAKVEALGGEVAASVFESKREAAGESLALSADYPGLVLLETWRDSNPDEPNHAWRQTLTEVLTAEKAADTRDAQWVRSPWTESEAKKFLKVGTSWSYDISANPPRTMTYKVTKTDDDGFTLEVVTGTTDGKLTATVTRLWREGTRRLLYAKRQVSETGAKLQVGATKYTCRKFVATDWDTFTGAIDETAWAISDCPLVFARIERTFVRDGTLEIWTLTSLNRD